MLTKCMTAVCAALIAMIGSVPAGAQAQKACPQASAYDFGPGYRRSAAFAIVDKSNPQTVAGTATLIHPDGYFITAAHVLVSDPASRWKLSSDPVGLGYQSTFEIVSMVLPSEPCTPATHCNERKAENDLLAQLPAAQRDLWKQELDFAIIKATVAPMGVDPTPLRRGPPSLGSAFTFGFPSDLRTGATDGVELQQGTAFWNSEKSGAIPYYAFNPAKKGMSGALVLDSAGRGFGLVRRVKKPATSPGPNPQTPEDIGRVIFDDTLTIVVPIEPFVAAGYFDKISQTALVNSYIADIEDPQQSKRFHKAAGSLVPRDAMDFYAFAEKESWSLFDNSAAARWEASGKINTLGGVQRAAWSLLVADIAYKVCDIRRLDAAWNAAYAELKSPTFAKASAQDFDSRLALASFAGSPLLKTELADAEADTSRLKLKEALYTASLGGFFDDGKVTAKIIPAMQLQQRIDLSNWAVALSDTQLAMGKSPLGALVFARQVSPTTNSGVQASIFDRVGIDAYQKADAGTAAYSFLRTKEILSAARAGGGDKAAIDTFLARTDENLHASLQRLDAQGKLTSELKQSIGSGKIGAADFYAVADKGLVERLEK